MSFLQEKYTRGYIVFLGIISVFLFLLLFLWHEAEQKQIGKILVSHEEVMVSALLEEGVPKEVIADTYGRRNKTDEGRILVHQLGINSERALDYTMDNELSKNSSIIFGVIGCVLFVFILSVGTIFYLRKREKLYLDAAQIMEHFEAGDFSDHLPRNDEGALFYLFRSADRLAMTLRSKEEEEHQGREFMKDTISDISHQLKTPLAALNMYNEIISSEPQNEETVAHFTEKSALALNRMEQLIQSLLKVTRLDAGSIPFSKEKVQVKDLVRQAVADLETRAVLEEKEIRIQGDEELSVVCDEMWTGEAIGNLVKNALDHTKKDGVVIVAFEKSPAMLRITVSDNGSGIPEEDIHHIFKRFYRGVGLNDKPGVGLGLPLAKAIIEGQGGLLSVQSESGVGSVFTICFLTEL